MWLLCGAGVSANGGNNGGVIARGVPRSGVELQGIDG